MCNYIVYIYNIYIIYKQLRIKCMSIDIFGVASSKFGEYVYIIVSLAKLQTSVFWMKNIKSFIKRLSNSGPMIELCGTSFNISR